jgi:hypothetical protein
LDAPSGPWVGLRGRTKVEYGVLSAGKNTGGTRVFSTEAACAASESLRVVGGLVPQGWVWVRAGGDGPCLPVLLRPVV